MAKKPVGDLLALSLLLVGVSILTNLTDIIPQISLLSGIVGSAMLVIVEGYFLIKSWFGK